MMANKSNENVDGLMIYTKVNGKNILLWEMKIKIICQMHIIYGKWIY